MLTSKLLIRTWHRPAWRSHHLPPAAREQPQSIAGRESLAYPQLLSAGISGLKPEMPTVCPQPLSSFASSLFCSPPYFIVFHPLLFCLLTIQKLHSPYWSHPYILSILTPWESLTSKRLSCTQGENDPPSQGFVCL